MSEVTQGSSLTRIYHRTSDGGVGQPLPVMSLGPSGSGGQQAPQSHGPRLQHALRNPHLALLLRRAVRPTGQHKLHNVDGTLMPNGSQPSVFSSTSTHPMPPSSPGQAPGPPPSRTPCTIVLLLDYDGTCAPIVQDPENAYPQPGIIPVLRAAAAASHSGLRTVVLSGRSVAKVRHFLAPLGTRALRHVVIAGSHGHDVQWGVAGEGAPPDTEAMGIKLPAEGYQPFAHMLPLLARARDAALAHAVSLGVRGVTVEDNRYSVSIHYRNVDPACHSAVETMVRGIAEHMNGLEMRPGKMVWELRPAVPWGKGHAVRHVLDKVLGVVPGFASSQAQGTGGGVGVVEGAQLALQAGPSSAAPPLLICIGDDHTDEDMFRVLQELQGKDSSPLTTAGGVGGGGVMVQVGVQEGGGMGGTGVGAQMVQQGRATPISILVAQPVDEGASTGMGVPGGGGKHAEAPSSTHLSAHTDMTPHAAQMPRNTAAEWYLRDPSEVRDFLAWVVGTVVEPASEAITAMNQADVHPLPQEPGGLPPYQQDAGGQPGQL